MPPGVYQRKFYKVGAGVEPISEESGVHECEPLRVSNEARETIGDSKIYMFKDVEFSLWNMKVGFEFIQMPVCCPFCGERFFGGS